MGEELENTLPIIIAGLRLKRIRRAGWVEHGVKNPESVADHTYSLALITMLLADLKGLDAGKAVKMALLHDLAEAYLGDLTPRQKRGMVGGQARRLERSILTALVKQLQPRLSSEYLKLIQELYEDNTPEAKLVHELDKLEMALESIMLELEHGIDLRSFRRDALKTEIGKGLLSLIRDAEGRRS